MRALITGGKGFVGQWLAAHLKDLGDEVVVIDVETDVAEAPPSAGSCRMSTPTPCTTSQP